MYKNAVKQTHGVYSCVNVLFISIHFKCYTCELFVLSLIYIWHGYDVTIYTAHAYTETAVMFVMLVFELILDLSAFQEVQFNQNK